MIAVVIVVDLSDDVESYAATFPKLALPRPPACPGCGAAGHLIGHGSYRRTVVEPTVGIPIPIKRLLCTACHHTVSLLPTFCLPFRHYGTATIQTVLGQRIEAHASWIRVARCFVPSDLPTLTTCREWVDTFTRASDRYLSALLRHLATWTARSSTIEVVLADIGARPTGPAQLVAAVPHLLAGLREAGLQIPAGGRRWLGTLWQWGWGMQLGRLV